MNITTRPVGKAENYSDIKKLYHTSFPKHELLPWWILRILAWRKGIDFTAYYADEIFGGFTYTVTEGKIICVLFFAVDHKIRNQGYGSAILQYLKETNPDKTILLNVELLDENADNYAERVRRVQFYQKNGFYDTQYNIDEVGGTFRVLGTASTFEPKAYQRVFMKLGFGLWKPKIERVNTK